MYLDLSFSMCAGGVRGGRQPWHHHLPPGVAGPRGSDHAPRWYRTPVHARPSAGVQGPIAALASEDEEEYGPPPLTDSEAEAEDQIRGHSGEDGIGPEVRMRRDRA